MAVSLVGITVVQVNWIKRAAAIHEAQFDSQVNEALNSAVKALAKKEKKRYLYNVSLDTPRTTAFNFQFDSLLEPPAIEEKSLAALKKLNAIKSTSASVGSQATSASIDSGEEVLDSIARKLEKSVIRHEVRMENFDSSFHHEVLVLRDELTEVVIESVLEQNDPVQWVERRTLDTDIDSLIRQKLNQQKINSPFRYSLVSLKPGRDTLYSPPQQQDPVEASAADYLVDLFSDGFRAGQVGLALELENRNMLVLSRMAGLLALSTIFTLAILASFGMALYFLVRQKRISEIKNDFINNMTHELKTPLATIGLASDSITHPAIISNSSSIRSLAQRIKNENQRMNRQIERVLEAAQLERGQLAMKFVPVDMHELLETAVESFAFRAEENNGYIRLHNGVMDAMVHGDSEHLFQVFGNLLDNSLKYCEVAPQIDVFTGVKNGMFWVQVADNGVGIPRAQQKRIFSRFYRISKGDLHDVKGFGLGLAYVQQIVELHHGRLNLSSEVGKGTEIEIQLPLSYEEA